jgi:hypothetical protein
MEPRHSSPTKRLTWQNLDNPALAHIAFPTRTASNELTPTILVPKGQSLSALKSPLVPHKASQSTYPKPDAFHDKLKSIQQFSVQSKLLHKQTAITSEKRSMKNFLSGLRLRITKIQSGINGCAASTSWQPSETTTKYFSRPFYQPPSSSSDPNRRKFKSQSFLPTENPLKSNTEYFPGPRYRRPRVEGSLEKDKSQASPVKAVKIWMPIHRRGKYFKADKTDVGSKEGDGGSGLRLNTSITKIGSKGNGTRIVSGISEMTGGKGGG